MSKKTFFAVSALIGTIIGAGFLGIPYVVMKSGFGFGLLNMLIIAVSIAIIMLYLGEITLRTKTNHQLAGYAEKYLGKQGRTLMLISVFFGIYSALVAYLIGEGESLSYLFFNTAKYEIYFAIAFWLILSSLTFFGMKALKSGESIGVTIMFVLIIILSVVSFNKINFSNLSYNNLPEFFTPFGVILFAFLAFSIVPELKRILKDEGKSMKKSIIVSYIAAFIVYAAFTAVVLGFKGLETPEIATFALGNIFVLLGMITMFTAYLALSIALEDNFKLDMNKSRIKSWLLTVSPPLIIYLILQFIGKADFVRVIGVGGAISGTLTAFLILKMIKKSKKIGDKKPEYSLPYSSLIAFIIMTIFIIGTIFEIINAFR